jgi:hypothetical protein
MRVFTTVKGMSNTATAERAETLAINDSPMGSDKSCASPIPTLSIRAFMPVNI